MGAPLGNRNASGPHKKSGRYAGGYKPRSISKSGFHNTYWSKKLKRWKQRVSYGKRGN